MREIGELIDPERPNQPEYPRPPDEPQVNLPTDAANFNHQDYIFPRAHFLVYKVRLAKYHRQQEALYDLVVFIQETLSVQNAVYIRRGEAHSWIMLRALKRRLALGDWK
jgi:hypothetical protein